MIAITRPYIAEDSVTACPSIIVDMMSLFASGWLPTASAALAAATP